MPQKSVDIQRVDLFYLPILASLHAQSFKKPWSLDCFEQLFAANPYLQLWLAFCGGMPVGFLVIQVLDQDAEVITLGVVPSKQRLGIGCELMKVGMLSLQSLFLEVSSLNEAARSLYKKLECYDVGYRPHYYEEDGSDAYVMKWTQPNEAKKEQAC
jgi:ribosomal-protein-alanine N-acetyltransferase